jgi:hypothetical protein
MAQKVGLLNDPVWSEPAPRGVRPDPRASQRRRRGWRIALVALLVIASVITVLVIRSGHPGGDPRDQALGQIRSAVADAIPPGSLVAGSQFAASQWQSCGYDGSGGSGWSQPTGGTAFRTPLTDQAVASHASTDLQRHGWMESPGASTTSAIWTKSLTGGSLETLHLVKGFAITDGWTAWADATVDGSCPN